jgi:predicted nucleotidyltransferase
MKLARLYSQGWRRSISTKSRGSCQNKKTTQMDLTEGQRAMIRRVAAKHGAHHVRIFGSMARGEASSQSDLDLLVDKGTETTPWFPAGLILELEELLQRDVDVVTENGLSPLLKERILQEAVPL